MSQFQGRFARIEMRTLLLTTCLFLCGCNLFLAVEDIPTHGLDDQDMSDDVAVEDSGTDMSGILDQDFDQTPPDLDAADASDAADDADMDSVIPGDWWDTRWRFRVGLRFESPTELIDVPVLIRLDAQRYDFSIGSPGGDDIVLVNSNGVELPHEVIHWGDDQASIWVGFTEVDGPEVFYLYSHGPRGAYEDPESLWDSFLAVYPLGETLNDSSSSRLDAVARGNVMLTTTPLGGGRLLDGVDGSFIDLGITRMDFGVGPLEVRHYEIWFRASDEGMVFLTEDNCSGVQIPLRAQEIRFGLSFGNNCQTYTRYTARAPGEFIGSWHYLSAVANRVEDRLLLYVDGALEDTATLPGSGRTTSTHPRVGATWNGTNALPGAVGMIRMSAQERSAEWVAFQYDVSRDAVVSYGPMERISPQL